MVTVIEPQSGDPEHTFLTAQELADSLPGRIPLSRLGAWRRNGGGPAFVKFGRTVAYRLSDVEKWIAESTRRSTADQPLPLRGRKR